MSATAEAPDPQFAGSAWNRAARTALFVLLVLQIVGVVLFIAAILVGETTRLTFYAVYAPPQPLLAATALGLVLAPLTQRRVRLLLALEFMLLIVVLLPVMGLHVNFGRSSQGRVVRLASYNVYFGKMGRPELLDELATIVDDVDILLIQAPYDSMVDRLRERFPNRTVERYEDLIVVTRFKIRALYKPTPIAENVHAMYAGYQFDTEDGPFKLYNVHPFSPRHGLFGDEEADSNIANRETQIEGAVLAAKAGGAPFLVVGDTNLPPLSRIAHRRLTGMTDAFADVGFGFGYTFPSKHPWMRIDRAFGSDGVRFLDMHVGPRGHSDHCPIFVDFELVK